MAGMKSDRSGLIYLGVGLVLGGLGLALQRRSAKCDLDPRAIAWCAELMRRTPAAIAFLDDDLCLVGASDALDGMLASESGALVGRSITSLAKVENGGPILALLEGSDATRKPMPAIGMREGQDDLPLLLRAVRLNARPRGWFIELTDLSQQIQFDRLKSDFVSTVSHELRTPLSSIAGALGLVVADAAGNDASEMIAIALNNTNRLIRLINDLLDVERIESGRLHFDMRRHSLGKLLRTAVDEIRPFADQHQVAVQFEAEAGEDCVCADSDRAVQVFTNLLSNAIKFSPPQGKVVVRMVPKLAFHRIEFVDNGPGIPQEFRSRIFTRFAQADGSGRRRVGGTGLGLAISRQIVDRLDGKLWFADNPDGGTIFCMDLPAAGIEPQA